MSIPWEKLNRVLRAVRMTSLKPDAPQIEVTKEGVPLPKIADYTYVERYYFKTTKDKR